MEQVLEFISKIEVYLPTIITICFSVGTYAVIAIIRIFRSGRFNAFMNKLMENKINELVKKNNETNKVALETIDVMSKLVSDLEKTTYNKAMRARLSDTRLVIDKYKDNVSEVITPIELDKRSVKVLKKKSKKRSKK